VTLAAFVLLALLATCLVASGVAFVQFALDKRAARRGDRRTPERTLIRWSLAGGWPGAFAAMSLFRHKTSSPGFRLRISLAALAHAGLVTLALAWWLRSR
jgi:uncharacterized membrane protein YsdA (DUF1294 family)